MGGESQPVSWYDNSYKKKKGQVTFANQQGITVPNSTEHEDERSSDDNIQVTDPSTVNLKANTFNKVAKSFTQLFDKDNERFGHTDAPGGWTTTGELGNLRAEQDAQYEFMEELEMKIEELRKEVVQQKLLIQAYETREKQNEEYLQHCMHWITMAQVFGDVPVAKDRMLWKSGRDAALIGGDEMEIEGEGGEAVNNNNNAANDAEDSVQGVPGANGYRCKFHAMMSNQA